MAAGMTCSLTRVTQGFDGKTCWVQARVGAVPAAVAEAAGRQAVAVVTLQKLLLSGSDVFEQLHETRSEDGGVTWSEIRPIPTLARWKEEEGVEAVMCDATPRWHATTGKLLLTGHVARYVGEHLMPDPRPRQTVYAVWDPQTGQWSKRGFVEMPAGDDRFFTCGAGSGERVDLPDGDILLPVYTAPREGNPKRYSAMVLRCGFDGRTLALKEIGSAHTLPVKDGVAHAEDGRGMYEPSVAAYGGRFYMTIRNDTKGYVTSGDDGLRYDEPRPWRFDDGELLGNYNTQQHWVSNRHGLYLVYTRRGLNNDHVFRHRAPLVIARVDPQRLVVLRETERVIVPERGARLGNFSVLSVNDDEAWVTAAEWMQNAGMKENPQICTQYGSDNSVFMARLRWA